MSFTEGDTFSSYTDLELYIRNYERGNVQLTLRRCCWRMHVAGHCNVRMCSWCARAIATFVYFRNYIIISTTKIILHAWRPTTLIMSSFIELTFMSSNVFLFCNLVLVCLYKTCKNKKFGSYSRRL